MAISEAPLRVSMVGHGFMGAVHSQAWRVAPRFFDLPRPVEMALLVGRDQEAVQEAASRWGWTRTDDDWRRAVGRDDIDLIDICTPGRAHAEIAIAALQAGKHVLCEKPLANTVAEAGAMAQAARRARDKGIFAMVGFTYRRVPAVQLARQLVLSGQIGEVRQVRAAYLQDWLTNEAAPMTWRLDKAMAGAGALGDLGSHIIDAVQFVTGQLLTSVTGITRTFVPERPLIGGATGLAGETGLRSGRVTVDDAAVFLGILSGGILAAFEATRMAAGRKNALRLEISGSAGAVAFDLEDFNCLQYYHADDGPTAGFRRILVTEPEHPYVAAWWPPGHALGYEHAFSHQVADLVVALSKSEQPQPSFEDGFQVQRVMDAVERSSRSQRWEPVAPETGTTGAV
jgi:predicted dehydrogenase